MNLRILGSARDDLIEGYFFYEERERGLGDYFLSCLYSDIEALRIYGGVHPIVHEKLHRSLSKRFPYALYYSREDDGVTIRAVLDCRRKPSWIRKRISDL